MRRTLRERLVLDREPATTGDLLPLLVTARPAKPRPVFIANAHAAEPDAIQWILQALLNPPIDLGEGNHWFVIEGALDIELHLERCAEIGVSQTAPLILHEVPTTPWHRLVDVDAILAARGRRAPAVVAPLLADACCGDVRMLQDVIERLPEDEFVSAATIEIAFQAAIKHGKSGRELRAAAASLDADSRKLAAQLAVGSVVPGMPPGHLRDVRLKALYLAGVVFFDPVVRGYRIRGPMVAEIFRTGEAHPGGVSHQHALASMLSWHISTVELMLREVVAGGEVTRAVRETSTTTKWTGVGGAVRKALASTGVKDKAQLAAIEGALKLLPEKQSVFDAARSRLGLGEDCGATAVLAGVTFDELVGLASSLKYVSDDLRALLGRVRETRNAVAHARPVTVDEALACSRDVRAIVQALDQIRSNQGNQPVQAVQAVATAVNAGDAATPEAEPSPSPAFAVESTAALLSGQEREGSSAEEGTSANEKRNERSNPASLSVAIPEKPDTPSRPAVDGTVEGVSSDPAQRSAPDPKP